MQQPLQLRKQVPPQPSEDELWVHVVGQDGWHTQCPPEQKLPAEQIELPAQLVGQLAEIPSQRYVPQLGLPAAPAALVAHVPVPHVWQAPAQGELQQNPWAQLPDLHWFVLVHGVPLSFLQSMSCPAAQVSPQGMQAIGQKVSACAPPQVRADVVHVKVQLATAPALTRTWSASLTHASDCAWHDDGGSHVSPASMTELPQVGLQSLSVLALQLDGQQPSPPTQSLIVSAAFTHFAVQAAAVPCSMRSWHPTGGQEAGQFVPSQVSLQATSVTPLPHLQLQSSSVAFVQPDAQQLSPLMHMSITLPVSSTQAALQSAALPTSLRN
jgi:hypothetical protein